MSCSNGCSPTGSGVFAGNDACGIQTVGSKARKLAESAGGSLDYSGGIPYARTSVKVDNMIPIIGALTGGQQLISQKYASDAAAGTVTKPKTIFGKGFGLLTGRTAAYKAQEAAKSSGNVDPSVTKNLARQGVPVSGGISFGNSGDQTLKILGIVAGVVVSYFFFNKGKKGRKRR